MPRNQNYNNGRSNQNNRQNNRRNWRNNRRNNNTRSAKISQKKDTLFGDPEATEGLFEMGSKGFGFLRSKDTNYAQSREDVFVTPEVVRTFALRNGYWVSGECRQGSRGPQLSKVEKINGMAPKKVADTPYFSELTAINPDKRIILETKADGLSTRVIDMMTPIGKGQRGLIVAPPRTGKTTILQRLAEAVQENQKDMKLMIVLIDERPEEVTEFRRLFPKAIIMSSSNDNDTQAHTRIAQLAIERAKRFVELGEHVFMILDSITRMSRAFNNSFRSNGRSGSGGVDLRALSSARKIFAAARNTREAGSLTIIATALIETNSRADELIFQEFKGTGNLEIVLDRSVSEQYVYPAIDIFRSGTRREEMLLPAHQLEKIFLIRRGLSGAKPLEAIQRLLSIIQKFPSNPQLLLEIKPK